MYYIPYSYLSKGGKLMNQCIEGWKIDVKNIKRALSYTDKALGLDMWGDKICSGLVRKIVWLQICGVFCVVGKLSYLGDGLFGFRYDNVGYIVSVHGAGWIRKGRKRESYNFSNVMAIEQTKPIYK